MWVRPIGDANDRSEVDHYIFGPRYLGDIGPGVAPGSYSGWRRFKSASGEVHIPPSHEVLLDWSGDSALDLLADLDLTSLAGLIIQSRPRYEDEDDETFSLASITHLTQLETLYIGPNFRSDAEISQLDKFVNLRRLSLGVGLFEGDGLNSLTAMASLEKLIFRFGDAGPEATLAPLAELGNLKWLAFGFSSLNDNLIESIGSIESLRDLSIVTSRISPAGLAVLGRHPGLRSLDLSSLRGCRDGFEALGSSQSLMAIRLVGAEISDADLDSICRLPNLRWLDLSMCQDLTDQGFLHLSRAERLELLNLNMVNMTDLALSALENLENLEDLFLPLGASAVTDEGLRHIGRIVRLRDLDVSGTSVTEDGIRHLAGLKNLRRLSLPYPASTVGSVGLRHLAALPNLNPKIRFDLKRIEPQDLVLLADDPRSQYLRLTNDHLTPEGLAALKELKFLRTLDLSQTSFGDEHAAALGELDQLRVLLLSNTKIGDPGVRHIGRLIGLKELTLGRTHATGAVLKDLSGMKSLQQLDLTGCGDIEANRDFLSNFPNLERLTLDETDAGDATMQVLSQMSRLKRLTLGSTPITDKGVELLMKLDHLEYLNLSRTAVSAKAVSTFRRNLPGVYLSAFASGARGGQPPGSDLAATLATTTSGHTFVRCLLEAGGRGISFDDLPAPTRPALREYIGTFLFYKFEPDLFWPHYPEDWQTGFKAIHRRALEIGYPHQNVNHAVNLAHVLFTPAEMGAIFELESIAAATHPDRFESLYYEVSSSDRHTTSQSRGVQYWAESLWEAGDSKRRRQLLDAFVVNPIRLGRYQRRWWSPAPYGPTRNENNIIEELPDDIPATWYPKLKWIPFEDLARSNPAEIDYLLDHSNYMVRQVTLAHLMKEFPGLVDLNNPRGARLLIEGLQDDDIRGNHYLCFQGLKRFEGDIAGELREQFDRTDDGQQKRFLATLLVFREDKASGPALREYFFALLGATEHGAHPPWERMVYHAPAPYLWAGDRLIAFGEDSRAFLIGKLQACSDAQQLAVSLQIINVMGGTEDIEWNESMIALLAEGLMRDDVQFNLGLCVAALKLAKPFALDPLEAIAMQSDDTQLILAVEILAHYYRGESAEYYRKRGLRSEWYWIDDSPPPNDFERFEFNRYWERFEFSRDHTWRGRP